MDRDLDLKTQMDKSWYVIFSAIQASLFGKSTDIDPDTDWEKVFLEAKNHTITAIVRSSVWKSLPSRIKNEWDEYDYGCTFRNRRILDNQKKLTDLFEDAQIPFVILKGTAAAVYYPSSELRAMGDIDFLVPESHFDEAMRLLLKNEYELKDKEDNQRRTKLQKNDITYEMHHRFNSDELNVDSYIERCFDSLDTGVINNIHFPMLPSLENGIVLLAHLRQHLFTGLGLRQIIDWMMYVYCVVNNRFWTEKLEPEVTSLGLRKLAVTVTRMCQLYLGLSEEFTWCSGADLSLCNSLMINIVKSGNFGRSNGQGTVIEWTTLKLKKNGYFKYLQEAGEYNWKAYKKHRWLKPFAWFYQIFRYKRQGISTRRGGRKILTDYNRGGERLKMLKDLDCL